MASETEAVIVSDTSRIESWTPTPRLRWNMGVLEQMSKGLRGEERWDAVPSVTEPPTG